MKIKGIGVAFMGCVMALASATGCASSKWVGDEVISPSFSWNKDPVKNPLADADLRR